MYFFILSGIKFIDGAKIRKATLTAAFRLSQMLSHLCNSSVRNVLYPHSQVYSGVSSV